ncbi:MAG: RpiB/LacA/LacB family sugar-phosphate isomerase, partial [Bacteroidota bacterium]
MPQHIHIAADHAGYELKTAIVTHLKAKGLEVTDHGTDSAESTDYPDYIHPMATAVQHAGDPTQTLGIAICGSANGVCMTANKHTDIRAAIAWQPELAALARQH